MRLANIKRVEKLIEKYTRKDGGMNLINKGHSGYGDILLFAEGLRVCIINEVYINPSKIGYKIKFYDRLPKTKW